MVRFSDQFILFTISILIQHLCINVNPVDAYFAQIMSKQAKLGLQKVAKAIP